jgi:phytoene synthase
MAPLLGAPERAADVGRLGVAFQLTNFIRDVREDWDMDRVYLPGLPEDDLERRRASDAVRGRVALEVARARELFAATADVPAVCDPAVRAGMRLARAVYQQVLDRVERLGFDVVGGRADLPPWEIGRAVLRA